MKCVYSTKLENLASVLTQTVNSEAIHSSELKCACDLKSSLFQDWREGEV